MKKLIKSATRTNISSLVEENTIRITMYLHPTIYSDSQLVLSSIHFNKDTQKHETDVNPYREINGPLSKYGEELEPPIKEEYEEFIRDCIDLVKMRGFTIISTHRSTDSLKSEYVILFGMEDEPCGRIIYDLRISDHPFDTTFPEELKDEAIKYLKMNNVLDETATQAGINFSVEKVTVGSVQHDTWNRAFTRLGNTLDKMRRRIRQQNKIDNQNSN